MGKIMIGQKQVDHQDHSEMDYSYQHMLHAFETRDASYDGAFYVGVLTTRIYCLPSCKARKPLRKNIVFFPTREEAIRTGFQGCKRCRSEFYPDTSPSWFSAIMTFLNHRVESKVTEKELVQIAGGVNISTIRRYFKTRMSVTPLEYHRKRKMQHAKKLLETHADQLTVSDVCSLCGFSSLSGFRQAFIKEFGYPPGQVEGW